MQTDLAVAVLADGGEQTPYDIPAPGTQRHQAVRHALAEALALARLQAVLLSRLEEADQAGDTDGVRRCHAELDHVMARMAETEQVRTGTQAALAVDSDLACAGCGAAAEPVYETPVLLGYQCAHCGWAGEDPAAQDRRKRADALEAAAAAVPQAAVRVADAIAILGQRGKQARAEGITVLRDLQESLTVVSRRLRKTSTGRPASAPTSP